MAITIPRIGQPSLPGVAPALPGDIGESQAYGQLAQNAVSVTKSIATVVDAAQRMAAKRQVMDMSSASNAFLDKWNPKYAELANSNGTDLYASGLQARDELAQSIASEYGFSPNTTEYDAFFNSIDQITRSSTSKLSQLDVQNTNLTTLASSEDEVANLGRQAALNFDSTQAAINGAQTKGELLAATGVLDPVVAREWARNKAANAVLQAYDGLMQSNPKAAQFAADNDQHFNALDANQINALRKSVKRAVMDAEHQAIVAQNEEQVRLGKQLLAKRAQWKIQSLERLGNGLTIDEVRRSPLAEGDGNVLPDADEVDEWVQKINKGMEDATTNNDVYADFSRRVYLEGDSLTDEEATALEREMFNAVGEGLAPNGEGSAETLTNKLRSLRASRGSVSNKQTKYMQSVIDEMRRNDIFIPEGIEDPKSIEAIQANALAWRNESEAAAQWLAENPNGDIDEYLRKALEPYRTKAAKGLIQRYLEWATGVYLSATSTPANIGERTVPVMQGGLVPTAPTSEAAPIRGREVESLPDPAMVSVGTRATDTATGKKYISNGTEWVAQ